MSRAGRPAVLVLAAVLPLSCSAGGPTAEGYWTGTIDVSGGQVLEIMVDVVRGDAGWRATFYAPAQGIHGVEMTEVVISGRSVGFRIPQAQGEPTFHGEMAGDGSSLSGTFDDAGQAMPFHLTRAERPAGLGTDIYAEYRQPGAAGDGLVGSWRALLVTGPNRIRLLLDVQSDAGGLLVGSLTSLDQGRSAMTVDAFKVDGASVDFEMLDIGALYKGTMKPDGSEIYGVWIQTGSEFPLTFRRMSPAPGTSPAG